MSANTIKNVIFDMGGVLFKWEPLVYARRFSTCEEDAQALAQAVFLSPEWAFQDAGAVSDDTVAWVAKTRLPERLHGAVDDLVGHWHEHRTVVTGMDALIADLKRAGFGVYLLSNAGSSFETYKQELPGYEHFDGIVVSYREHIVKPDTRIFQTLLERFDLDAATCLFVDDTPINVAGAKRAGMQGWHFKGDVYALKSHLLGTQA